ncbi:unnamed protein product [uncultured bacterium]|nr:unnamed protein product [uncultured bacterium]
MSYLQFPCIHFAGRFQADTSTVNNDVRHFDDKQFLDEFQKPMEVCEQKIVKFNGYWNPEGSGAWRMLGCKITSAVVDGKAFTRAEEDPVIGQIVGGSNDQVAGKLVDLDPQQQMVSQIWGLCVRLENDQGVASFSSDFEVAPFCDLWLRQQAGTQFFEQHLAAAYQSILKNVAWKNYANSSVLSALRARTADDKLSIRMNVFGYDRTPSAADYGTGAVIGTIGPYLPDEPKHFVTGRQLTAALNSDPDLFPFVPANGVGNIQAAVDGSTESVSVDFGNAFPTTDSTGTLQDLGPVVFGVLKDPEVKQGDGVGSDRIEILGAIPYRQANWFVRTAGIEQFSFRTNAPIKALIEDHPLVVARQDGVAHYTVLNRETADGVYVRADAFVFRMNPGDSACIDFRATKYGRPFAATVNVEPTMGLMGGPGTGAKLSIPIPDVGTPSGVITYNPTIQTMANGCGSLTVSACKQGPGNPRVYLDGQLYGLGYQLATLPKNYNANPMNYISVLAWDSFDVPENPTWFQHIQPILAKYANLYPLMSRRLIDLGDYDSVVRNLPIMKLSFTRNLDDPNYMPVTRDLSLNKRKTILKWLNSADPCTGKPPRGEEPPRLEKPSACAGPVEESSSMKPSLASKVEFLRQALKNRIGK